jgi:pantetheine-phosphate adenylyltransferase
MSTIPKIGIYAGTFDPPTLGHHWMITECSRLCDKLIIAVAENPSKKPMFSAQQRVEMLQELAHPEVMYCEVEVIQFQGRFLVHEAMDRGVTMLFRGIRNAIDFEYEMTQRLMNEDIAERYSHHFHNHSTVPTTVFLSPPAKYGQISSSMVKWLIGLQGWNREVCHYVPESVFWALRDKHENL